MIEAYVATDDSTAARRRMNAFVERYPDDPRATEYRQILAPE